MTLQFYRTEHQRLLDILTQTDPRMETYHTILNSIGGLDDVALRCIDASERIKFYEDNEAADSAEADNVVTLHAKAPKTAPKRKSKSEEHPVEQPFPDPEPEPTPVTEEPAPLTLAEVKAAFTAAAKEGVKVSEIINDTGYAKLSEVPSELYAALMRALERKKAGEE